jgi:O-antigen biosynthesis protein
MLGRFMDHDEKGQRFGAEQFKLLCQRIPGWELVCAGALWPEKRARRFFRRLKRSTRDWPIQLQPNLPFADLKTLVGQSKIFWHTMGHGRDLARHPELAEHFGMPTVECMRAGCVPLAFDGGGQPEIIESGQSGYLWRKPEMLLDYTLQLAGDAESWDRMSRAAIVRASAFSRDRFERTVFSAIDGLGLC